MTIAPQLREASGRTDVIVHLERAPISEEMSDEEVQETLRGHATETQESVVEFAESHDGVELQQQFWLTNAVLLTVDTDDVDLEELADLPGVEALVPNEADFTPAASTAPTVENRTSIPNLTTETGIEAGLQAEAPLTTYGLAQINAPAAWDRYDARGEGVKVAILDSGVDVSHPDIDLYTRDPDDPTYPGGWAEFDEHGVKIEGSTPYDVDGHGTHVSGTVAGGNASGRAIGVAPEVDLMHGLVVPSDATTISRIYAALEWVVEEDADVVSMSLGDFGYDVYSMRAVRNADAAGTVVVAASGNYGEGSADTPGNVYESISVGATDEGEVVVPWSSGRLVTTEHAWGVEAPAEWPETYVVPDVTAPGNAVFSADLNDSYSYYSGTSMAAPHVAGTLALMLSASETDHSVQELKTALYQTARKPPGAPGEQDTRYGHGIVDALAATETLTDADPIDERIAPGSDFEDATELPPDVTVNSVLDSGGGDMFAVEVPAGADLEVTFRRGTSDGVSAVALYDPDRTFLGISFAGTRTPVTIEADVPEDGTYYVQVLDVENGVGPYSLSVATEDRPREIVEVEPNDDPAMATPVLVGVDVSGEVSTPEDVDYFTFQADEGDRIEASVTRPDGQGTFVVDLLGPDLDPLATGEIAPGETATLTATTNRSGPHYLAFRSADDESVGPYTFVIRTDGDEESRETNHRTPPLSVTETDPIRSDRFGHVRAVRTHSAISTSISSRSTASLNVGTVR